MDTLTRLATEPGLAQRAYTTIRERILRGDYAIGQVISRRRVAADLGISFLPASEALLRLECEGLLESRPRAGTRIRIPTRPDVQGHFVVREALEVQAAMLFAENATREERTDLQKLAARLDARGTRATADPLTYLALHEKLHIRIAECTRCAALEDSVRRQSALGAAWLCAMKSAVPHEPYSGHEALIRALSRQKPSVAGETMRAHVHADMKATLECLEPYFETNKKFIPTYSRSSRKRTGIEEQHPVVLLAEAEPPAA
jgi:DNA-binding GntR family transcriptional regulator